MFNNNFSGLPVDDFTNLQRIYLFSDYTFDDSVFGYDLVGYCLSRLDDSRLDDSRLLYDSLADHLVLHHRRSCRIDFNQFRDNFVRC